MTFEAKTHSLGWYYENDKFFVFFGNRQANLDSLKSAFPKFQFIRARQVHGSEICQGTQLSDDLKYTADGVLTEVRGMAVCSITADCVPVLITNRSATFALAVHAGWRGVAGRIVPQGIASVSPRFASPRELHIFIGPHIQSSSFEVKADALVLLAKASQLPVESIIAKSKADSFWVDLKSIIVSQLKEVAVDRSQVTVLDKDTFISPELHSHRRDREKAGRQISFLVLK